MSKDPFYIDSFFDTPIEKPFIFNYKKQDLKVISKTLGDIRTEFAKLSEIDKEHRDEAWYSKWKYLLRYEERCESATNYIIRNDFLPKLNY